MKRFILLVALLLSACQAPQPQLKHLSAHDIIVAFGDSLTFGTGAGQTESYPAVLEKIIGIKVINEGMPGEDTAGGLARIGSILDKDQPSLVILCLGGNDHIRKRATADIRKNLKNIIDIIRRSGADVLLIAPPEPSLSLSVPALYAELGDTLGIPVDDSTLARLLRQPDMKSDYIHLNAAGYRALAESIADILRKTGALQSR